MDRFAQVYSKNEIDLNSFSLGMNPYREDAEDEVKALKAKGIIFFRDEDHTKAAVFEPVTDGEPIFGFYSQFSYNTETGELSSVTVSNTKVKILWSTETAVHRILQ